MESTLKLLLILFQLAFVTAFPEIFIAEPNNRDKFKEGDQVIIYCITSGPPFTSVVWKKDGQALLDNDIQKYQISNNSTGSFLNIKAFGTPEVGNYTCVVTLQTVILSSRSLRLQKICKFKCLFKFCAKATCLLLDIKTNDLYMRETHEL